ncbi:MAG: hypothetical protein JXR96_16365 [Deltaproteobacteria bacterium]|nr:hypothetical protein [Deltaproteobacteria bacterium]
MRDIRIIALAELRHLMRSAQGILAFCFLAIYTAWVLSKLVDNADFINSLAAGRGGQGGAFILAAAAWLADIDNAVMGRLLDEHSAFLFTLFAMLAWALPMLTMIASLDQNASDIGSRGIRFLLTRTSRGSLLLGRFAGTALFWIAALGLVVCAGTLTALAVDESFGVGAILVDGLWLFFSLTLIALPFIAFLSLCSVVTGNPLLSATMGIGCYLGIGLLGFLGGLLHEAVEAVRYAFPDPLRFHLLLGTTSQAVVATLVMPAFTTAYLLLAGLILRRRDL